MRRRVVLIGATGFFGRRLAERLVRLSDIELVVTSRTEARARAAANSIGSGLGALAFERQDRESLYRLRHMSPWLVIDASGPFQSAGYDLAHAVLDMGAHWIDLADARGYLLGFKAALDSLAHRQGLVARAGVSSTPALSFAVVEDLTAGWQRLDSVDIAILPGGAGQVGEAVIRAILSYAGSPVAVFAEGHPAETIAWGSFRRFHVEGLGTRYLSPVETVDADVLPQRFGVTSRVSFHAGLESRIEQFNLLYLTKLKRLGILGNLVPFAPALRAARLVTRVFASDRGGMTVDCAGLDGGGRQIWSRWTLIAERGAGPNVPVLPAIALTRALLGDAVEVGADINTRTLKLADIEREMHPPDLRTYRSSLHGADRSLFAQACGDENYGALPSALRAFHDASGPVVWSGESDVDASGGLVARSIRRVFGFPASGRRIPITVTVDRRGETEIWTRNFAGKRFASRLAREGGNVVSERFGPFRILLGIEAANDEIRMPVVGWRLGPLKLPLALAPKSATREFADDAGRFRFDVAISLPLVGLVAHYRGWLEPKLPAAALSSAGRPETSASSCRHRCPSS